MTHSRKSVARAVGAAFAIGLTASAGLAGISAAGPPPDGSVGNADDKAPGGQSAGDRNKGYECDDNHGIGDGNPAHTCETTTTFGEA